MTTVLCRWLDKRDNLSITVTTVLCRWLDKRDNLSITATAVLCRWLDTRDNLSITATTVLCRWLDKMDERETCSKLVKVKISSNLSMKCSNLVEVDDVCQVPLFCVMSCLIFLICFIMIIKGEIFVQNIKFI